jgi:hypothetical protein
LSLDHIQRKPNHYGSPNDEVVTGDDWAASL